MTQDGKPHQNMSKEQFESLKKDLDEQHKMTIVARQRSNAFNSVNMSMTSLHSYFYQADAAAEVTDSMIEQVNIDDFLKEADSKMSPLDTSPLNTQASRKNLKIKPKVNAKQSQKVGHTKESFFADFSYSNPELPARDA